ncbi:NAD(P)/FAD-dependent oxidoreductase [Methylobacterium sp. P1-11]|uniref:NAD(P)/FAD-dependent oxidoreductase n=1 Tax=Methylobacterium sp. P1-11 TaxID=2024616 RepID=UPI0011EDE229|nr:NAD(P)/FAD-dependent oxidoreductase [Methylobacterium sp. P1-11]KAA0113250.1 NAD(P)/FAD-dependent oxidoreductase [Methylobacterium sp. P1-11]
MPFDAIVVGGSFAGLSAATYIARGRRSVCVIDTGSPRNRFAAASHGFFGQDGSDPRAMIAQARAQLATYPQVTFVAGEATDACVGEDFTVTLATGETLHAARLVLAHGISDVLPDLPGLAQRWGKSVLHCPYCHGYEFAERKLGVLAVSPLSAHQALLIAEWGPTTLYLDGGAMPDEATCARLVQRGIEIEPAALAALSGPGETLSGAHLTDGRTVAIDALYLAPRSRLNGPLAERLGCVLDEGPFGPVIRTDAAKLTTVVGVYAAGDIARAPHSVSWAVADGVTAGVSVHQSLAFAGLAA